MPVAAAQLFIPPTVPALAARRLCAGGVLFAAAAPQAPGGERSTPMLARTLVPTHVPA